jgi:hypothetical protein
MTERTDIKMTFTQDSLYLYAMMFDSRPENIMTQMTGREGVGNSENFILIIDTYYDQMNGYGFGVSSANSQSDAQIINEKHNGGWDAIWNSEVTFNDSGWALGIAIPFSALQFSKDDDQIWGINFYRTIRRKNETGTWNEVIPIISGSMTQMGKLIGLTGLKSHSKLILQPYLSSIINFGETLDKKSSKAYRGGMDLHFTPNKSTIVDMILLPDFGQVSSDNKVLNLSYSEVIYGEKRPFFNEGIDVFSKGRLFLSRRVGGTPSGYENVYTQLREGEMTIIIPSESLLINATKVIDRRNNNPSVGVFNATTEPTYAIIEDSLLVQRKILTEPYVNYNVFVLDKILKNKSGQVQKVL